LFFPFSATFSNFYKYPYKFDFGVIFAFLFLLEYFITQSIKIDFWVHFRVCCCAFDFCPIFQFYPIFAHFYFLFCVGCYLGKNDGIHFICIFRFFITFVIISPVFQNICIFWFFRFISFVVLNLPQKN